MKIIDGNNVLLNDGRKGKIVDIENYTIHIKTDDGEKFAVHFKGRIVNHGKEKILQPLRA